MVKRSIGILGIVVVLALVALGGVWFFWPAQPASSLLAPATTLHDMDSIDDLRARFNADAGVPRIILLVSPT